MRKVLAFTLALTFALSGFPLRADEPVRHYFNIGVHPVDSSRQIDWETECRVELTEPSPPVKLSFLKNGALGETHLGNIRAGYSVVTDKPTGFAKWVNLCGNDIMEPKNWIPVGRKECRDVQVPTAIPPLTSAAVPPAGYIQDVPKVEVAIAVVTSPVPTPIPTPTIMSSSEDKKDKKSKKKGSGVWKVVGGVVIGAAVALGVCALTKHCDFGRKSSSPSGGGPSPDPPN